MAVYAYIIIANKAKFISLTLLAFDIDAGSVVGAMVFLIFSVTLSCYIYQRKRDTREKDRINPYISTEPYTSKVEELPLTNLKRPKQLVVITRKGTDSLRLMEAAKHGVATMPLSISVRAYVSRGREKITIDKAQVDRVKRH